MTDTVIVAIVVASIAALPPTVIATATLVTAIRAARKTEVIRAQTDGHLTKLTEQLAAANERGANLERLLVEMGKTER